MVNYLSQHRPNKQIYLDELSFSHYLSGIIDGDGHINKIGYIVICFNEKDLATAYFIKKRIGYGQVRKIKDKKAFNFIVTKSKGISYISSLIKDKIKHPNRINQFNTRLYPKYINQSTSRNSSID